MVICAAAVVVIDESKLIEVVIVIDVGVCIVNFTAFAVADFVVIEVNIRSILTVFKSLSQENQAEDPNNQNGGNAYNQGRKGMQFIAGFDIHPRHLRNNPEETVVRVRNNHCAG